MTLTFDEYGRAEVRLVDRRVMSVITPERNAYIRERKTWSPGAILHGWDITDAQADDNTYEVAFLTDRLIPERFGDFDPDFVPEGWADYSVWADGDRIFAYVPRDVVEAYAEAHSDTDTETT